MTAKRTITLAILAALATSGTARAYDRYDVNHATNRWAWDVLDPDWASGTELTYTWSSCAKRPAGWTCRLRAQIAETDTNRSVIQIWWLHHGKLAPKKKPVRKNEMYVVDGDVKARVLLRGTRGLVFYVSSRWSQNA